ncbi:MULTISPECIES: transglycosylase family protein [unclassified Kitasatospora]|uniref:transglycosylase family protein n=1 Tax=unclassified Kitasatospora TaxID=2633591 RepID=UPI0012F922DD|nr:MULTISPECIES: transglycosylase family protein [unclassified Kitasatospora]
MGEERIFMLSSSASKRTRRLIAATGVVGIGLSVPCLTAGSASAATVSTWDKVAQCEATGDWSINTGNGFYGGLQFTSSTWAEFGGKQYAAQANQASKGQQIAVAEKVLASQGPGAWPVCSVKAGLTKGGSAPQVDTSASTGSSAKATTPKAAAPAPKAAEQQTTTTTTAAKSYTVVAGDWLSTIAQSQNVEGGWEKLYELNRSVLSEGPDMIYPGQQLALGGTTTVVTSAPKSTAPAPTSSSAGTGTKTTRSSKAASGSTATTAVAATGSKAAAINFAMSKLGQAYVYGGSSNGGWDCSGLTQAAFRQAGISLPRIANDQADAATRVSLDNLKAGDLLFWSNNGSNSGVYHVAIYIGDGKYVEAANPRAGVKTESIANWAPDFAGRV